MTLKTPSKSTLFGLGEFAASQGLPLKRNGRSVTLWNRDQPSRYTDQNLYGSYPFLLQLQEGRLLRQAKLAASSSGVSPLALVCYEERQSKAADLSDGRLTQP